MECPICAHTNSKLFIEVDNKYCIVSCENCEHSYLHFQPLSNHASLIYSDDYFKGREDGYPDYIALEPLLFKRGKYYSNIIEKFAEPGYLLDVGSGVGFIMKGFKDNGWEVKGVEPNIKMAKYGRDKFDLDISTEAFEIYSDYSKFDLITMIQVIAHCYEVRKCMENASRLLKSKGLLLIETWNNKSFTAKIMSKAWHEYSPPSVTNWFNPSSLSLLAEQFGLTCLMSKRTFKKIQLGHAKSLLSSKSDNSFILRTIEKSLKLFPDETELIYPGDDLFFSVFRKN